MPIDPKHSAPSSPLVALSAWLLPGSGYWLIGQRGRAMGVGITIIILFILGLLIAGVRVIEVPGYEVSTGARQMYPVVIPGTNHVQKMWSLYAAPLSEIRDKPWSVPQVMTGPIAILAGMWSVASAAIDPSNPGQPIGATTHARTERNRLALSLCCRPVKPDGYYRFHLACIPHRRADGRCQGACVMGLLAYRPFLDPLPIWDYWFVLIIPLCVAVAIVYKSMKCRTMSLVPKEAGAIVLWIIGGFSAAAVVLMVLVNWLSK